MRKLALSLSLAFVLALAMSMSAFAAAKLTVTGDTTIRVGFAENADGNYELQGNWRTRANLVMDAGSGAVTGKITYRLRSASWIPLASRGVIGSISSGDALDGYVNFSGSFIPGTQDVNLRVGRLVTNMDNWIANFSRQDGVHLTGLDVGPVNLNLYQGWEAAGRVVTGVAGTATLDVVELKGVYVGFRDSNIDKDDPVDGHKASNADYVVSATVRPVSGISVSAEYAVNGPRKTSGNDFVDAVWGDPDKSATAWKISGEMGTVPNFTVRGTLWSTDDDFRPVHRTRASAEHIYMDRNYINGNSRPGSTWGDPYMAKGFSIGATTEQAGLPITVDFKSGTIFKKNLPTRVYNGPANLGGDGTWDLTDADYVNYYGKSMNVFSVGTTIAEIGINVKHTTIEDHDDSVTDIVLRRSLPLAHLLGADVALKGTLRLKGDDRQYAADATWRAPNGLLLGVHYANYDRVLDWDHNNSPDNLSEGINIGKPGKADGLAITASYQLNF